MISDPSIRDQAYQYFLEEAPELLETIEQELFAINDGDIELSDRPLRVNKLMRATHTLKGGAANVGLETIKTVAHSMEDVFKALYNPELEIDHKTKKLLYASYDCLRIPLTAEFSKAPIDREEILNRAAGIFAELTEIFGDYLSGQDAFPTSEELGLDVVQSFFESVVPERIQELSVALSEGDPEMMTEVLQSQAEIFLGLSQSLNLSGLGDIAQTILTALEINPHQVKKIAVEAIANFQQAQQQVMNGDRDRGGEPSPQLQQYTEAMDSAEDEQFESASSMFVETVDILEESARDVFGEESLSDAFTAIIDSNKEESARDMFGEESLGDDFTAITDSNEEESARDMFSDESLSDFEENNSELTESNAFFGENKESGELMSQIWGNDTVADSLEDSSFSHESEIIEEVEASLVPQAPSRII